MDTSRTEGGRRIIGQLVKYSVLIIAGLIVCIIASAYVWYFVGMAVSLAAGALFGVAGGTLASIFAWIGVGTVVATFVKIIAKVIDDTTEARRVRMSEEDFEKLFGDISEGE